MTYASPGPISTSVPSSCLMASRPEWTTPTWRAWQLSVPATGLTQSDQRHPGSNATVPRSSRPYARHQRCVLSGVLVSSGESKFRDSTPAMAVSSRRSTGRSSRSQARHCKHRWTPCEQRHSLLLKPRPAQISRSTLSSPVSTETRLPGVSDGSIAANVSAPARKSASLSKYWRTTAVPSASSKTSWSFLIGAPGSNPLRPGSTSRRPRSRMTSGLRVARASRR